MLFPHIYQKSGMACGPTSLAIVLKHYGYSNLSTLLDRDSNLSKSGSSLFTIGKLGNKYGLSTKAYQATPEEVNDISLPAILHFENNHFVVLYKIKNKRFFLSDPAIGKYSLRENEFVEKWNGVFLELKPDDNYNNADLKTEGKEASASFSKLKYKPLITFFKKNKTHFTTVLVLSFVIKILFVSVPLFLKFVIDNVLGLDSYVTAFLFSLSLLLLLFILAASYARDRVFTRLKFNFEHSYFSSLFQYIIRLRQVFFDNFKKEDIINRFHENTQLRVYLSSYLFDSIFNSLFLVVYLGIIFFLSSQSFFIALVALFANIGLIIYTTPELMNNEKLDFYENNKNLNAFLDGLLGLGNIKALNAEYFFSSKWNEKYQFSLGNLLNSHEKLINHRLLLIAGSFITRISFLFHSVYLLQTGVLSFGDFIAVIGLFFMLLGSLNEVSSLRNTLIRINNSLDRITDFFLKETEFEAIAHNTSMEKIHTIILSDLSFSYDGEEVILKNINFTFNQGLKYGIVGKNGSGKTSLVKLLVRFYTSYSGSISVNEVSIKNLPISNLRKQVFYFPSDVYIFDDSIRNNLLIANPNASDEDLLTALRLSGLNDLVDQFYLGLDHRLGDRGMKLSTGQRLKFGFARLFVSNPSVIILDEATSSLDPENEAILLNNIFKVFSSSTIISIAHRIHTLKDFDEVLVMDKGSIVANGSHNYLLSTNALYQNFIETYNTL